MAATANTTIQLAVPDGLRGRVMSVYTTIFAGSTPIGGPVMGGLASVFGVAISLAIGGVLSAAVGIGAFAWIRRRGLDRRPLRAWSADPAPTAGPLGAGLASASMPDGARPR
jgi:MFS family permease